MITAGIQRRLRTLGCDPQLVHACRITTRYLLGYDVPYYWCVELPDGSRLWGQCEQPRDVDAEVAQAIAGWQRSEAVVA